MRAMGACVNVVTLGRSGFRAQGALLHLFERSVRLVRLVRLAAYAST